jgi:hypothetical protein
MRIGTMVILLSVLGFCIIGLVSTFGQQDATKRLVSQALYGSVGLVCLITAIWAARPEKPSDRQK